MIVVKDADHKKVCAVDAETKTVVIQKKNRQTIIHFTEDGHFTVHNK